MEAPNPRRWLWILAGLTAFTGLVAGYTATAAGTDPALLSLVLDVLLSYAMFSWYCRDSEAVGFERKRWMSIAILVLSIVAVPFYLVRSRPSGEKGRAVLRYVGFMALMLAVSVGSAIVGAIVAG